MSLEKSFPHTPCWDPFKVAPLGGLSEITRPLNTLEGIGDRLRSAAFAEIQAREAFNWAADYYEDAPQGLKKAWRGLALAEDRHLNWLLNRMSDLNINIQEKIVSDQLWHSLVSCPTAQQFSLFMARSEERGRKAGFKFHQALLKRDPISADIFGRIAEEEIAHIEVANQYFN